MMRRSWMAAVVVALIALNVWRWWPDDAPRKQAVAPRDATASAHDLRLTVAAAAGEAAPRIARDVFALRKQPPPRAEDRPAPRPRPARSLPSAQPAAPALPPEPPPKTPEQLEAEAAQAELARIKLVGVIFRDAKPQAYFARDDRTYMVSLGETVERFTVTAITAESARLHDPRTQVGGLIPVLGK